ncbi:MAG: alginate lyase family protein [Clostridia bacterium]|nr:alginate lyase family protein [Clostridia bacterium]
MSNYPSLITFDGSRLPKLKKFANSEGSIQSGFKRRAEEFLEAPRMSVVDRKLRAPSGNEHDYTSMGPYWWPNPDTSDGLPYVRRDGEINPETRDSVTYQEMVTRIFHLSLAAYYYDDARFAKKAVKMIRDWHIEPETYMTPHLEYGQAIPGYCLGRSIGLIDTKYSYMLFNAIRLLEFIGKIDEDTLTRTKAWYSDFTDWMLTSEIGIDEDIQPNNHGTWYDVQISAAALFCDRPTLAARTLAMAYDRRVLTNIMPDGAQPHELKRTRAISYSSMNLDGLFLLGNMARLNNIEAPYWDNFEDGECLIARATEYLYQSCKHFDRFAYQEISGDPGIDGAVMHVARIAELYPASPFAEIVKEELTDTMDWRIKPIV